MLSNRMHGQSADAQPIGSPPSQQCCPGRSGVPLSRRQLLQTSAGGFGLLAFSALSADRSYGASPSLVGPHFKPRAKQVIFCFMDGGVSHVDSFDPKPKLAELDGQPTGKIENPTANSNRKWLRSPWKFRQHGECGLPVSELFPNIAACADDLAVVRSLTADQPLHASGVLLLHTGSNFAGRPSLGAWTTYGLGSENENLPGFVLLSFGVVPCGGLENYSHGFLPANHQATHLMADGPPIDNIIPADSNRAVQRAKLGLLAARDRAFATDLGGSDAIDSAIRNYELAYRMQTLVPDVLDLSQETKATLELYGIDSKIKSQRLYGTQCLRARRLVESGVRFVEVACPPGAANGTWDQHGNLKRGHEKNARDTDQAVAALITDLKARGMLDETLVVWAGEFGRTPHSGGRDGRDHHPEGFTVWLAGGGARGGTIYGATDELGMFASEGVATLHDLHATILHLLGLDHERLTFHFGGRDMSLTDVHGRVLHDVVA